MWIVSRDFFFSFNPLLLYTHPISFPCRVCIMWLCLWRKVESSLLIFMLFFCRGCHSSLCTVSTYSALCVSVCCARKLDIHPAGDVAVPLLYAGVLQCIWWSVRTVRALVECRLSHSQHRWRNSVVPASICSLPSSRYTWNQFFFFTSFYLFVYFLFKRKWCLCFCHRNELFVLRLLLHFR